MSKTTVKRRSVKIEKSVCVDKTILNKMVGTRISIGIKSDLPKFSIKRWPTNVLSK